MSYRVEYRVTLTHLDCRNPQPINLMTMPEPNASGHKNRLVRRQRIQNLVYVCFREVRG